MCIVKDTYYIRIRIYAQQVKKHDSYSLKTSRKYKMFEFFPEH